MPESLDHRWILMRNFDLRHELEGYLGDLCRESGSQKCLNSEVILRLVLN
jgi:hypothetical protein